MNPYSHEELLKLGPRKVLRTFQTVMEVITQHGGLAKVVLQARKEQEAEAKEVPFGRPPSGDTE